MLHFLSIWLAIDEVLLNYSVISQERQGKGTKGNTSINTEDEVICNAIPLIVLDHCIKMF
jgi:hypothetical protein